MLTLSQSLSHLQRRSVSPRPTAKCMNSDEIEEMKKSLKIELNNENNDNIEYHPPPIRRKNCMYSSSFSFTKK